MIPYDKNKRYRVEKRNDINFCTGPLPGWLTRTDPIFALASDLKLTCAGSPKYVVRNYEAYGNEYIRQLVSWNPKKKIEHVISEAKSFIETAQDFPCPAGLLSNHLQEDFCLTKRMAGTVPDHLVKNIEWFGDHLEKLSEDSVGNHILAHICGKNMNEIQIISSKGKILSSHNIGHGKIQQLAPLHKSNDITDTWTSFVRSNCTATLVQAMKPFIDESVISIDDPISEKEKFVFKSRIAHVAPSPHISGMAAFVDEHCQLYIWNDGDNIYAHSKVSDFNPALPSITRQEQLVDISCEFTSHPMNVWVISGHFAYNVDIRAPPKALSALSHLLRPLPYHRQGYKFIQPLTHAILQSRTCPYSTYICTDEHLLLMDTRLPRDPVLRWDMGASGGICNRLRWHDSKNTNGLIPDGVLAYGGNSLAVLYNCVADSMPSGGVGWQMGIATSHKGYINSASYRPMTFSFPIPYLPEIHQPDNVYVHTQSMMSHGGVLLLPCQKDGNVDMIQLLQSNSTGDVYSQHIAVSTQTGEEFKILTDHSEYNEKRVASYLNLTDRKSSVRQKFIKTQRRGLKHDFPCGFSYVQNSNESEDLDSQPEPSVIAPPSSFSNYYQINEMSKHKYLHLPRNLFTKVLNTSRVNSAAEIEKICNLADILQYREDIIKYLSVPRSSSELEDWCCEKFGLKHDSLIDTISQWNNISSYEIAPTSVLAMGKITLASRLEVPNSSLKNLVVLCAKEEWGSKRPTQSAVRAEEINFQDITLEEVQYLNEEWNKE